MGAYVIPNVVQKFSGVKVDLWHWLEENIGNQDGTFELNQSALAKKFNVSRKSIHNALKTFQSANLLEKVESRTGRGVHSLYRLVWTFREEESKSVTPSRVKGKPQEKNITKGRQWRYYAYKFRTAVENSSLANKAEVVVGKILKFLRGKTPDIFQEWLIHLKRWLNGPPSQKTLKDFFVFFHDGLLELFQSKKTLDSTEERIKRQQEQREEVREEYEEDPPPRLRDYGSFADYQEAMEEWSEE